MPPAAISRSSTNLPKICGNIARAYRSALAGLSLLSCACASEPEPVPDLPLALHQLEQCALPDDLADVSIELDALGDFPASNRTTEALPASAKGRSLRFPEGTLAASAVAAAPGGARWWGYGERKDDRIEALLWPEASSCKIASGDAFFVPGGQALGFSRAAGVALAVGKDSADPRAIGARGVLFDVATGVAEPADMELPLAFATVTESGERLLVAGGLDPTLPSEMGDLLVFDPATRQFDRPPTRLYRRRAKHAAVVLQTGETLLVGGIDQDANSLVELEAISPVTLRTRVPDLSLSEPRSLPYAFALDDGRIFVGGGEVAPGEPARSVEWLLPDASGHADPPPIELEPRLNRAFIGLPGGAVLGVGGCEPVSPSSARPDCAVCCPGEACAACPPASGFDAVWIGADGSVYPFALDFDAPRPLLVAASDGAPFLVSEGANDATSRRLFRFDPWNQHFDPVAAPAGLLLPPPGGPRPLAIDAGTFVWLAESDGSGALFGMRHDIRNRYSRDVVLLADPLRPQHVAPDRPPGPTNGIVFDGRLELAGASVRVTDTDYGDLSLEIVLHAGPPPVFLLGGAELGGLDCPWPAANAPLPEHLSVTRSGEEAKLIRTDVRGELVTSCAVAAGRTSLGLRGDPSTPSVVSQLVIRRGLAP